MRAVLGSIGALLISAAILLAGGGLFATLIAVRGQIEGFPITAIGLLTSAYYAGFIGGCLGTPYLVKRVGHVRVFAALSSLIASAALIHVLMVNIPVWILLRLVAGFAFAGLYMLIESWINEQAPNESRGQVLSIYRMVDLGAVTAGQFMLTLADPGDFVLFALVAIFISLAIFPISVSASQSPQAVTQTSLNIKKLVRASPLAVVGAFVVGLTNGSFWGVAPVFVQQLGHPIIVVSTFMSAAIFSGAVLQWPVGWLSDKFGRRAVMAVILVGSSLAGFFLWQFSPDSQQTLLIGAVLYGAFAMQVFGLCAAHANDYAGPNDFVAISGGLLLIYGVGSVIGPSVSPIFMSTYGPSAMFGFTGCMHALLFGYTIYRMTRRANPVNPQDYVSISRPRSMNLFLRADPRTFIKRKKAKKAKAGGHEE